MSNNERRSFLCTTCKAVAGVALATSLQQILSGCATVPHHALQEQNGVIEVPLSVFGTLSNPTPVVVVTAAGVKHAIAVVQDSPQQVHALYTMCTHKHCPLDVEDDGFVCSCHGSTFDLHGRVTNGPAKEALTSLPVTITNTTCLINTSGLH